MKLLIVGGGGLIGQAIAKKHLAEGDEVYIHDIRVNPWIDYSDMVGIDVTNQAGDLDPDIISHQAALVGVGQSQYDIHRYVENNIGVTSALLQAILKTNKTKIKLLFAGSMGPYGECVGKGAIREIQKQHPKSIYAVTKQTQENLIKVFSETYDISAMSLRYFSVYSTTQNPLNPLTGVLSIIANKLLNSEQVELFGSGLQYRDLIEVSDVADAHFLASRLEWKGFDVVNVGTGVPTKLIDIATTMKNSIAPSKQILFNGQHRKGDIEGIYANTRKMNMVLGWNPKVKIEDGIRQYCEFINANREKYTLNVDSTAIENLTLDFKGLIK
jgi:dTDP-L-rhamnose 4-epimerase